MRQLLWAERKKLHNSKIIRIAAFAVVMTVAKMIIAMVFSILIYFLLFAITFAVEAVLHFRVLSVQMVFGFLYTYFINGLGIFFAVSPIIALAVRIKKGYLIALIFAEIYSFAGLFASMSETLKTVYPITAVFKLSGYYEATNMDKAISLSLLFICAVFAIFILKGLKQMHPSAGR